MFCRAFAKQENRDFASRQVTDNNIETRNRCRRGSARKSSEMHNRRAIGKGLAYDICRAEEPKQGGDQTSKRDISHISSFEHHRASPDNETAAINLFPQLSTRIWRLLVMAAHLDYLGGSSRLSLWRKQHIQHDHAKESRSDRHFRR
jgi:hypothetical protein